MKNILIIALFLMSLPNADVYAVKSGIPNIDSDSDSDSDNKPTAGQRLFGFDEPAPNSESGSESGSESDETQSQTSSSIHSVASPIYTEIIFENPKNILEQGGILNPNVAYVYEEGDSFYIDNYDPVNLWATTEDLLSLDIKNPLVDFMNQQNNMVFNKKILEHFSESPQKLEKLIKNFSFFRSTEQSWMQYQNLFEQFLEEKSHTLSTNCRNFLEKAIVNIKQKLLIGDIFGFFKINLIDPLHYNGYQRPYPETLSLNEFRRYVSDTALTREEFVPRFQKLIANAKPSEKDELKSLLIELENADYSRPVIFNSFMPLIAQLRTTINALPDPIKPIQEKSSPNIDQEFQNNLFQSPQRKLAFDLNLGSEEKTAFKTQEAQVDSDQEFDRTIRKGKRYRPDFNDRQSLPNSNLSDSDEEPKSPEPQKKFRG